MDREQVPDAPVFIDSPLAIRATEVFRRHAAELEDGDAVRRALRSPRLRFTETADESRAIANVAGFHIVIAASGMCDAGRIRHHLKRWLWNSHATVLMVGFQAAGTLGRVLRDGAHAVRIQGETVRVAARIAELDGYSAHADGPELGRWLAARGPVRGGVFLVHGEPDGLDGLAQRVAGRGVADEAAVVRPALDDAYELAPAARPELRPARRRRSDPEHVGQPDWHNERAALLLELEETLDDAPDDARRQALLDRMRRGLRKR